MPNPTQNLDLMRPEEALREAKHVLKRLSIEKLVFKGQCQQTEAVLQSLRAPHALRSLGLKAMMALRTLLGGAVFRVQGSAQITREVSRVPVWFWSSGFGVWGSEFRTLSSTIGWLEFRIQ